MVSEKNRGVPVLRAAQGGQPASASSSIDSRIAEIRRSRGETVSIDEIASVVQSILSSMTGDLSGQDLRIYNEIGDLARYIQAAKADIAALNPADIREEFLPTAADELDAIVESTEAATGAIMDAAEVLDQMQGDLPPEAAAEIQRQTTRIYEACSFQDITGQRISKVIRMLKNIEERVDGLVAAFDPSGSEVSRTARPAGRTDDRPEAGEPAGDEGLLNGPQLEGRGIQQGDVDEILAKFD